MKPRSDKTEIRHLRMARPVDVLMICGVVASTEQHQIWIKYVRQHITETLAPKRRRRRKETR